MASLKEDGLVIAGIAVAVLGIAWYLKNKALEVAPRFNPANSDNYVNAAVTDVYQAITGSTGTIGTDVYDATHGGAVDATSPNNAIYKAANKTWQMVGVLDEDETIGTKIYDWWH